MRRFKDFSLLADAFTAALVAQSQIDILEYGATLKAKGISPVLHDNEMRIFVEELHARNNAAIDAYSKLSRPKGWLEWIVFWWDAMEWRDGGWRIRDA